MINPFYKPQKRYNKKILSLFILILFAVPILDNSAFAQKAKPYLDFRKSVIHALENGFTYKDAELELQRNKYRVEAAQAGLKSNAEMSFELPRIQQSLTEQYDSENGFYEFISSKKDVYLGSIRINQPLKTNGNISFNSSVFRQKQSGSVTDYTSNFYFEISQPVFSPNAIQRNIRSAELQLEQAKLNYINRIVNNVYGSLIRNFYQLFEYRVISDIDSQEVRHREESLRVAKRRYQEGALDEMELLQMEVDLTASKNNLSQSKNNYFTRKNNFKRQIGLGINDDFEIIATLQYRPVKIDIKRAVELGLKHNPSLKRVRISEEFDRMELERIASQSEFKGTIVGTYGLNASNSKLNNILKNFEQNQSLKIKFVAPIWDWGKNQYFVDAQRINLLNTHLWIIDNENNMKKSIENQVYVVFENRDRVELLKNAQVSAQENYSLALRLFKQNKLSSSDLTYAQSRLTSIRKSYIDAVTDYYMELGSLTRLTHWDFEKNEPVENQFKDILKEFFEDK